MKPVYLCRVCSEQICVSKVFVSADILAKMREFEWIDDLTRDVFVASFIYFPNADAISLPLDWFQQSSC